MSNKKNMNQFGSEIKSNRIESNKSINQWYQHRMNPVSFLFSYLKFQNSLLLFSYSSKQKERERKKENSKEKYEIEDETRKRPHQSKNDVW